MREPERLRPAGILVPVTTPFDAVTGEVAPVAFRDNLRRWIEQGVDGVVLFGSTGEGALLDPEEKVRLIGFARDLIPPGRLLVAGADGESTRGASAQAARLGEAGAEALLVHAPAYFGVALSSGGLRDHFVAVADASPVPIILYNIPKYVHVVLEPGLIEELSRHPNIVGLKDSSGDLKRFGEYADACGDRCALLVGSGALLYAALELGAAGGIVALGLLAAAECREILERHRAGDTRGAGALQERIAPVHREIVARHGAPGVKAALDLLGLAGGPPRPPLAAVGEKETRELARVMQEARLLV